MREKYSNILFWDDKYDIYEIFDQIDCAIIDYSSIFYDLLESGVRQFIRYIPDYEEYIADSEFIADYFEYTDGAIVKSFSSLLETLGEDIKGTTKQHSLMKYFFEFDTDWTVEKLVSDVEKKTTRQTKLPELHSFDIFDTLIRRKTVEPVSIFYKVRDSLKNSAFSKEQDPYLIENYPLIRQQVEWDLRDVFRKTTFERDTDQIEVTLMQILKRLQSDYLISDEMVSFLYECETRFEIESVEPIKERIDYLFNLVSKGDGVYLISDMYLEKATVKEMLRKADSRLADLPLYLSSEIGYQKTTGKLFMYAFFDKQYNYKAWIHYGDNKNADGVVPRRFSIQTRNHDIDQFNSFENSIIRNAPESFKFEGYQVASLIQRFRWHELNVEKMSFNEEQYFAYAYIGTVFVPYVDWAIRDALRREYKTLYFISRDGYYLKQIADRLIAINHWNIKTKYIYGSRKVWRTPSFIEKVDEESFSPFGLFSNMDNFDDLVASSQLPEDELLEILPELESYRYKAPLKGAVAVTIREIFKHSEQYRQRLVEVAAERRPIVKKYLQQEINFNEKFAFVEFWGRGYTQDTHTRLLADAAGHEIDNPYYYIRNFTPNYGHSIRHRFTTKNMNYSYFENVFATTPYKTISKYEYVDDTTVKPVIESAPNQFHSDITAGLVKFADDYAAMNFENPIAMDRMVAECSSNYQIENPRDKFITDVFSRYKDNMGMYGAPQPYAPAFTEADVLNAEKKKNAAQVERYLRSISHDLTMSAAHSSDLIRKQLSKLMNVNFREKYREMPLNDLDNYIRLDHLPAQVMVLQDQSLYQSIDWNKKTECKTILSAFTVVCVENVQWNKWGIPRLQTKDGFITAHKDWVKAVNEEDSKFNYIFLQENQKMFDAPILENKRQLEKQAKGGRLYEVDILHSTNSHEKFLRIGKNYILFNPNFMVPINTESEILIEFLDKNIMCTDNIDVYMVSKNNNQLNLCKTMLPGDVLKVDGIDKISDTYFIMSGEYYVSVADVDKLQIVTNEIEKFYTTLDKGTRIITKNSIIVHQNPSINDPFEESTILLENTVCEVEELVWDEAGMPWYRLKQGFIQAKKDDINVLSKSLEGLDDDLNTDVLGVMADLFSDGK